MIEIGEDIVETVRDIIRATNRNGDGGRKVTIAEAKEILKDLERVGISIGKLIADAQS